MSRVLRYAGGVPTDDVVLIPDFDIICEHDISINEEDEPEQVYEATPQEIAEDEAQTILAKAQHRAIQLVSEAGEQAASIRASAQQQGYDAAFQSEFDNIVKCLSNANETVQTIQRSFEDYLGQYAAKLQQFSLEIASSIMKRKLTEDPLIMCDLVEHVMSTIKDAKWAVVALSKDLVPLIELLQSELPARCPTIASLEIEGKDIPVGRCIIDSSNGVIDASINEQLANLARRFEQIQQKRGTQ